MNELKHTPGPWAVVDGHYPSMKEISGPSFKINIVMSATDLDFNDYLKRSADAQLIAAAPELLGALEDMFNGWRYIRETHGDLYGVGWDRAEGKARAAIAKATGETK